MKLNMVLLVAAALLSLAVAAPEASRPINNDCVALPNDWEDSLFPADYQLKMNIEDTTLVQVSIADNFTVDYEPTYKLVNNTAAGEVYALSQCGAPAPNAQPGVKPFTVPLTSVAVPDTTAYAFMNTLGLADRIQALTGFVSDPCGQKLRECGRNMSMSSEFNMTALNLEMADRGMFVDGVAYNSPDPDQQNVFVVTYYSDQTILGRAEWIKYVGLWFNKEREADAYFTTVAQRYNNLVAQVAKQGSSSKPVVAYVERNYDGVAPYTYYKLSFAGYKRALVEDAGGVMLDLEEVLKIRGTTTSTYSPTTVVFGWGADGNFSSPATALTALLNVLKQVDVVVDETYVPTDPIGWTMDDFLETFNLTGAAGASMPFLQRAAVFRYDGLLADLGSNGYGYDWFEGAVVRPDEVLRDYVRMTNPRLMEDPKLFTWMRNLAAGEVPSLLTADKCTQIKDCEFVPQPICPFVQICADGTTVPRLANRECEYEACPAPAPAPAAAPTEAPTTQTGKGGNAAASIIAPSVAGVLALALVALLLAQHL